jgi:hypothetical protein
MRPIGIFAAPRIDSLAGICARARLKRSTERVQSFRLRLRRTQNTDQRRRLSGCGLSKPRSEGESPVRRTRASSSGRPLVHDRHAASFRKEFPQQPLSGPADRNDASYALPAMASLGRLLDIPRTSSSAHRPGWRAPTAFPRDRFARAAHARPGRVHANPAGRRGHVQPVTQLEISSTDLRSLDRRRPRPQFLMPENVPDHSRNGVLCRNPLDPYPPPTKVKHSTPPRKARSALEAPSGPSTAAPQEDELHGSPSRHRRTRGL